MGGTPTTYVHNLGAELTQVLGDGTNFYLYALASPGAGSSSRSGEEQPAVRPITFRMRCARPGN